MSIALVEKIVIFAIVTGVLIELGVPSVVSGLVGAACAFGRFVLNMAI
jgi:hypothetical protein